VYDCRVHRILKDLGEQLNRQCVDLWKRISARLVDIGLVRVDSCKTTLYPVQYHLGCDARSDTRLVNLFECKRNRSSQLTMGVGVCMYDKDLKLSQWSTPVDDMPDQMW